MSKVKLGFANKKFIYLYSTSVDNMFVNEFMPAAPGDYVKVYIYGLMMMQNNMDFEMKDFAHSLGMTNEDVKQAWEYWARNGLVKLLTDDETGKEIAGIYYVSLPEYFYGRSLYKKSDEISEERKNSESEILTEKISPENNENKIEEEYSKEEPFEVYSPDISEESIISEEEERINRMMNTVISGLFDQFEEACGRTISKRETQIIVDAIKVYDVAPDVMGYAIKYCAELEKYNIDYINKVAMRWTEEGCRDISQVREQLDMYSKRNANYAAVFKEMGFMRLPNPSDKALMDRWFDEMGYTLADVLNACRTSAGLREPTLKYVNKVLENLQLEAGGIDTRPKPGGYTRSGNSGGAYSSDRPTAGTREETRAKVSNKVLEDYYEYLRNESERIQNAHIDEVCSKYEDIRGIFEVENKLNSDLLSGAMLGNSKERKESIRAQRRALEEDKRELLDHYGYPTDYLDRKYKCKECRDVGSTDEGRICVCRKARAEEAYKWYQTIKKN